MLSNIAYISESGIPKESSIAKNPNTKVILNLYEYNNSKRAYVYAGRSTLLPASTTLHVNVSKFIEKEREQLKFESTGTVWIQSISFRGSLIHPTSVPDTSSICNTDSDPFIVEQILAKRFNSHKVQYEYLVKWLGYSSTKNTWELPINIPSDTLNTYENSILTKQTTTRSGRTRKAPSNLISLLIYR